MLAKCRPLIPVPIARKAVRGAMLPVTIIGARLISSARSPVRRGRSRMGRGTRVGTPRKKASPQELDPEALKDLSLKKFVQNVRRMQKGKNMLDKIAALSDRRRMAVANMKERERFSARLKDIINSLDESKCFDLRVYHTQRRLHYHDLMVVASSYSARQAYFAANKIGEMAAELEFLGDNPKRAKAQEIEEGWAFSDCRDVMVHVLVEEVRKSAEWEENYQHELIPEECYAAPLSFKPRFSFLGFCCTENT
mmetsp:Transcript_34870/g.48540  ORF Transcript_34870/g.48540 Transcript_34870/m.48540 type:complete len:252 (-) Transcript_34870:317-1072(-)